jgi:hypothetical protein
VLGDEHVELSPFLWGDGKGKADSRKADGDGKEGHEETDFKGGLEADSGDTIK